MRALRRLSRDEGGIAAVEFAMLAPILILLLMASVEFPRALAASQNLTRAARTIADLASRGSRSSLDDTYEAAEAVAAPYDLTDASIVVSAVGVYASGGDFVSRVCSSTQRMGTARAVKSVPGETPATFAKDKARYVLAEVSLRYRPLFNAFPALSDVTLSRTVAWPVRRGSRTNGEDEVVMPGGKPCPAT